MKEKIENLLKEWQEEFAFCEIMEENNVKQKEYLVAHNHVIRKEQIRCFINGLEKILK